MLSPYYIHNAPYIYLTKQGGTKDYFLFIAVRLRNGETINWNRNNNPRYLSGTTQLAFSIDFDEEAMERTVTKMVSLNPDSIDNGPIFNPEEDEVTVTIAKVTEDSKISMRSSILYAEADVEANILFNEEIENLKSSGKILNAPYIYLSNPQAEVENSKGKFKPRVIIFSDGAIINQTLITGSGSCAFTLDLHTNENQVEGVLTELNSGNISCNSLEYEDSGAINGNFTATINPTSPAAVLAEVDSRYSRPRRRRKGTRKNKSSISNPSPFTDNI